MLRAGVLALAALHAVGGFSASAGGEGIFSFGLFQRQIIQDLVVACAEDPRDGDLLRAALGAVAAAGAGDGTPVEDDVLRLGDQRVFLLGHGHEILHGGQVVFHLVHGIHAAEHGEDPFLRGDEAERPGSVGLSGSGRVEHLLHSLGRVCQQAALAGLHDRDVFTVPSGHFVYAAGFDLGVLPVGIVELELYEIDLGMVGEDPVQNCRGVVEGEAEMPDQSLFFLFRQELPDAVVVIGAVVAFSHRVEQIEIEKVHAQTFAADIELCPGVLPAAGGAGVELAGNGEAVASVAFHQRLAGGFLGALVYIGGVKIGSSALDESVRESRGQIHIDAPVGLSRETHQAEAQLQLVFHGVGHSDPPSESSVILPVNNIIIHALFRKSIIAPRLGAVFPTHF